MILWSFRGWSPALRALSARLSRLDDGSGLPAASLLERRLGRSLALLASVWFALVAFWEIGAPFGAGHYAASAAVGVAGENMLRFHTLLPITDHPLATPSTTDCYCHHPFGIFWTSATFLALLGHHDFVCRLPAALLSALTPSLLYGLGRSLWSPLAGGLCAVAFTLTPIALAFANFNSLEVPTLFGALLASLAYVRFRQTARLRFLCVGIGALLYASNSDFPGLVFSLELMLLAFGRVFLRGGRLDNLAFRRGAAFFGWGVLLLTALCGAYLAVLVHTNKLDELLTQGQLRSAGNRQPLTQILAARRYWLLLMFTGLAIGIGKLGAIASLARAFAKRSELELVPLLLLGMALFQYLVFTQGADVHIFWPHYFAPCFALGLAALAQSAFDLARALRPKRRMLALGVFGVALVAPLSMTRDALATLVYSRKTGGRFNEKGRFIQPDKDKVAALEFVNETAAPGIVITLSTNLRKSLWVPWVLQHPTKLDPALQFTQDARYYVTDARYAEATALHLRARRSKTQVVGPFWLFDGKDPESATPAEAFRITRREPNLFERYFVSSTHALRTVEKDAYLTWEIRDLLGQSPNPPPQEEPVTFEQLRVAHNIARQRADFKLTAEFRRRLFAGCDTSVETLYEDGTRLLAARFESGASDVLSVYFESPGPDDQRFAIRGRVEEKLAGSWLPADPLEREVGLPTTIPRNAWRAGYLYSSVTEILRRPGRERFSGYWVNTSSATLPLKAKNGRKDVSLLVLP